MPIRQMDLSPDTGIIPGAATSKNRGAQRIPGWLRAPRAPNAIQSGRYYYLRLGETEPLHELVETTGIRNAQSDTAVRRRPPES